MKRNELQRAVRALDRALRGMHVRGTAIAGGSLDLCVFFRERAELEGNGLRIALGAAARRRVLFEHVRLSRKEHLDSENARKLAEELVDARFVGMDLPRSDRLVDLRFESAEGQTRRIVVELFGGRGNWFLLDAKERVLALAARPSSEKRRSIGPGARWSAPPPPPQADAGSDAGTGDEGASAAEDRAWLVERAAQYAELEDETRRSDALREIDRLLRREKKALRSRLRGLEARREAEGRADEVRREAELLLASPTPNARGLESVVVQDWYDEGKSRELSLDPKLDVRTNAQKRFDRAKSLEDGRAHTERELGGVETKLAQLVEIEERCEPLRSGSVDHEALDAIAADARALARAPQQGKKNKRKRPEPRKVYHEFASADGTAIWVGRGRADNDKLTLRHARGNDMWLHVASGLAGSHVVVRLDRGKTASLETLLDAGTLAIWFSKARGRPHAEVLYTPRKYVRKPKGFALGLVEVTRSKTLQVTVEAARLDRLLGKHRSESR